MKMLNLALSENEKRYSRQKRTMNVRISFDSRCGMKKFHVDVIRLRNPPNNIVQVQVCQIFPNFCK